VSNIIVDDIGTVVAAMQTGGVPYYMYGHRLEISNRLTEKGKGKSLKYQKYPLVALRMDFAEDLEGDVIHLKLNIAFIASTEKEYTTEQRYNNVFKPVLYPLYESFLEKLRFSGLFTWPAADGLNPRHTKFDRPFWGTIQGIEGTDKYIFNDPLDAIEIVDLQINKNIKCK